MTAIACRNMPRACIIAVFALGYSIQAQDIDLHPAIHPGELLTYVVHFTRGNTSSNQWAFSGSLTDTMIGQFSRWSTRNLRCDSLNIWAICPYESAWVGPVVPQTKSISDSAVRSRTRRLYCVFDATDFDYTEFDFLTTWEFTPHDSIKMIAVQPLATPHWNTTVPIRSTLFPDGSVLLLLFRYGSGGDKFVTPIEKVQFLRSTDGKQFKPFYERLSEPFNMQAYLYQYDVRWLMSPFYSVAEFGEFMTLQPVQSRLNGLRSLDSTTSRVLNLWHLAKDTLKIDTTLYLPFYGRDN